MLLDDVWRPAVDATTMAAWHGFSPAAPRFTFIGKSRIFGWPGWLRTLIFMTSTPALVVLATDLRRFETSGIGTAVTLLLAVLAGAALAVAPTTLDVTCDVLTIRWLGLARQVPIDDLTVEPTTQAELSRHLSMEHFAAVCLRLRNGRAVRVRFGKMQHQLAHRDAFVHLIGAAQWARAAARHGWC